MTLLTPKDNEPSTVRVGGTAPAERQPTAFELAFQKATRSAEGLSKELHKMKGVKNAKKARRG